jgi:hypothetical protein
MYYQLLPIKRNKDDLVQKNCYIYCDSCKNTYPTPSDDALTFYHVRIERYGEVPKTFHICPRCIDNVLSSCGVEQKEDCF